MRAGKKIFHSKAWKYNKKDGTNAGETGFENKHFAGSERYNPSIQKMKQSLTFIMVFLVIGGNLTNATKGNTNEVIAREIYDSKNQKLY
jgi:hypothetical protein